LQPANASISRSAPHTAHLKTLPADLPSRALRSVENLPRPADQRFRSDARRRSAGHARCGSVRQHLSRADRPGTAGRSPASPAQIGRAPVRLLSAPLPDRFPMHEWHRRRPRGRCGFGSRIGELVKDGFSWSVSIQDGTGGRSQACSLPGCTLTVTALKLPVANLQLSTFNLPPSARAFAARLPFPCAC